MQHWTPIWGQAHAALSVFGFHAAPRTFRLVVNAAVCGTRLRVRLSNLYGKEDVAIGGISAAPCTEAGVLTGDSVDVAGAFVLKTGERFCSDAAALRVAAGSFVCVSVFVRSGRLTSGNQLNDCSLLVHPGDCRHAVFFAHRPRFNDFVRAVAQRAARLPLHQPIPLFDAVELDSESPASAIVVLGDSLSQQGYWVNPFSARIHAAFPGRYAVINRSITGNRVLRDASKRFPLHNLFGESALGRLQRDVLDFENVAFAVLALGVNDILHYATMNAPANEKPDVQTLVHGILTLTRRLHAQNIRVLGTTLINFGDCADAMPERLALCDETNALLRAHRAAFDGFFDLAAILADPARPQHTCRAYLGGDCLHLNAAGGQTVADAIDLSFFASQTGSGQKGIYATRITAGTCGFSRQRAQVKQATKLRD